MKAIRLNAWGQPVQLEDIPRPVPGTNEVLVRVRAASINPFDAFVHAGYMQAMISTPITMGTDFAGEVAETGLEITNVKTGDQVYGLVPMHSGSFAEYLIAKPNEVTQMPKSQNFIQAAGVPLASLAAYQCIFDLGQLKKGERVLIIGAAGAVGGCAVQLAKDLGAFVYAVDLPEKAASVHDLGADHFINAKEERYEDIVGKVDLVLDFVGGDNLQRSFNVLPTGGRYVTSLFLPPTLEEAEKRGISCKALATQPRVDQLNDLALRIDSGRLKTFVNRTYPLGEAQAAMNYRMSTTEVGKVILIVD